MPISPLPITQADLAASGWEQIVTDATRKESAYYSTIFQQEATQAQAAGEQSRYAALSFLSGLTSFHFKPDSPDGPFGPIAVFGDSRTAAPEDLSDEELDLLTQIAPAIADPEFKAWVCDILWIRRRNYALAQEAVAAYLASAATLEDPAHWSNGFARISRALRLATSLGRTNPLVGQVIAHIEALLAKLDGEDPLFFSAKLMELLLERGLGDAAPYAALSEKIARKASDEGEWDRAATLWRIKARWNRREKQEAEEHAALLAAAETAVLAADAELAKQPANHLVAVAHFERAIRELRKIIGTKERVAEIHNRLLASQSAALEQFRGLGVNIDMSEPAEQARSAVRGHSMPDCLLILASLSSSPSVSALRQQVTVLANQFPLQHLIPVQVVNEQGKVTGRRPSVLGSDTDENEAGLRAEMLRHCTQLQAALVVGGIEPAREQILIEHNLEIGHLRDLVAASSFVPQDREELFARGLYAGLTYDNVVALHLLLPQVEHTIMMHLAAMGVTTSGYSATGIQNELDLNTLLYEPKLTELLGENLVFDLQCLLVERFGSNLRNLMAHGLMRAEYFQHPVVTYAWWLVLRLCCLPILFRIANEEESVAGEGAPPTPDQSPEAIDSSDEPAGDELG